jgi:poly-gamma-glutamate synthesis protein (capsule biosynthesis protein)
VGVCSSVEWRVSDQLLRVVAVGDLMLGDSPTSVGFGFRSRHDAASLTHVLNDLQATLKNGDIVFGNLETVLSDHGLIPDRWASIQLRGDPSYSEPLRDAGFTVLSVANNHASQHGVDAFRESVEALRAVGITPCGIRGTRPWTSEPVILKMHGTRVGVVGYCLRPRQYENIEPPYAEGTAEAICADIERLRESVAIVLVSLHWGEEFVPLPSANEVELARSLVDSGATVVIGHHPHVVRPVERYQNGVIAYSLGNCVSDMIWYEPFRHGAVLSVEIKGAETCAATLTPTLVDSDYRATIDGRAELAIRSDELTPLTQAEYSAAIDETTRRQRLAVYRYVLWRLWRFPPKTFLQLLARTVRNKILAVVPAKQKR